MRANLTLESRRQESCLMVMDIPESYKRTYQVDPGLGCLGKHAAVSIFNSFLQRAAIHRPAIDEQDHHSLLATIISIGDVALQIS